MGCPLNEGNLTSVSPRRVVKAVFFVGDNHITIRLNCIRESIKLYSVETISVSKQGLHNPA